MTKRKQAAAAHIAATEAKNPQPVADVAPQSSPQQVLCFVFTPAEADLTFNALGKLPAEQSEGLRKKIKTQSEQQSALIKGLFNEPSVQSIVAAA